MSDGEKRDESVYNKSTLILGARGLPNKDRFSKSDPFVVLFAVAEDGAPKFVKRTETIKVCLNYDLF